MILMLIVPRLMKGLDPEEQKVRARDTQSPTYYTVVHSTEVYV